ncbi:hypothetical protein C0995_014612 [Termitomyces sp. Mi166|nr:hypothetical protein C0995_014612 [Termitomyces sp. Mi166\
MHLYSELLLQEQEEICAISSALLPTQESSQWVVPHNKAKGKAKAMEDDEDEEGEATQKLKKELEEFVVPTKFDNKLLASLLLPPSEYYKGDIELPQGAKISDGRKGDITLVSPATWVLVLEKNGAMHSYFFSCVGALLTFSFSVIIALLTIWLINVGTQLVNALAGAVIANSKAVCEMA